MLSSISGANASASVRASGFGGIAASLKDRLQAKFDKADANGDGQVERSEAVAIAKKAEHVDKLFENLDTDGDGAISQAEHDAGVEQFAEQIKQLTQQPQANVNQLLLQQFNRPQQQAQYPQQLQLGISAYQNNLSQLTAGTL